MLKNWLIFFLNLLVLAFLALPNLVAAQSAEIIKFEGTPSRITVGQTASITIQTTGMARCRFTSGGNYIPSYDSNKDFYTNTTLSTIAFTKVERINFGLTCDGMDSSTTGSSFTLEVLPADPGDGDGDGPVDTGDDDDTLPPSGGGTTNTGALKCAKSDELCNPLPVNSVVALVFQLLRSVLLILGGLTVAVIVYGGFQMVISTGNPEAIKTAKATITWAILGLVVALLSYSIVGIVQSLLEVSG